jgi:alpha-N-arabinofuranosidase
MIGAEPYVAVNTGKGGPESAAELVEYANGAATTPMGRRRAENGSSRPFGVKLWAVGNEMYGDWQIGHMPLEKYVEKHREVVDAMRAVDPNVQAVAVGAVGDWSRTMLGSALHMTHISEHLYWQDSPRSPPIAQALTRSAGSPKRTGVPPRASALKGKDIRIALDEWNYWYGPNEYGELGTRYFLQDGLGIAAGLHELFRNSDLFFMANYAQTVNVIGAIKTTATAAEMEPTGLVLALYRHHFGSLPVKVSGALAPLDVAAAWTTDRSALTVAVVNPTAEARQVALEVTGAEVTGVARRFVLTGADRRSFNAPGRPRGVTVVETSLEEGGATLEAPPLSVALHVLPVL